jgi:hypothetical protein
MADEEFDGNEHELCVIQRVYAFKLPVLKNAQGHRATDWDKNPVWKGRMRVVERNSQCRILLEHDDKPGIFGTCPVHSDPNKPPAFEPVLDSSRYFVLRLEDGKGNYAYIGIAFNTRDEAFEFKVALRDYTKSAEAEDEIKKDKAAGKTQPSVDYSLKGSIKLGGNVGSNKKPSSKKYKDEDEDDEDDDNEEDGSGKGLSGLSLAPPPEAKSSRRRSAKESAAANPSSSSQGKDKEVAKSAVASNKGKASADILGLDF